MDGKSRFTLIKSRPITKLSYGLNTDFCDPVRRNLVVGFDCVFVRCCCCCCVLLCAAVGSCVLLVVVGCCCGWYRVCLHARG